MINILQYSWLVLLLSNGMVYITRKKKCPILNGIFTISAIIALGVVTFLITFLDRMVI